MKYLFTYLFFLFIFQIGTCQVPDSNYVSDEPEDWEPNIFTPENFFEIKNYILTTSTKMDHDEVWCCGDMTFPKKNGNINIQKIECYNLPQNVSNLVFPITLKSLKSEIKSDTKLPSSLNYISVSCACEDSIVLPVKYKSDHVFLGWYSANNSWGDNVKYYKVVKDGHYLPAFQYLKDDFYTLQEEDCIFSDNIIYENFYIGAKKLKIPNKINGENITSIGKETFRRKNYYKIILPDSLYQIDEGAFSGNKLQELILPDQLKTIGKNAFAGNAIKKIVLSDMLDSIGIHAFAGNQIDTLMLTKNIRYIGKGAFLKNTICYLKLNNKVVYLGPQAFADNNFNEKNIPILHKPIAGNKTFLYWQSFKRDTYNRYNEDFDSINVSKAYPGDKMDLNLGYRAVFKEDL